MPAVRNAEKDTIIIADGFSCRGQIEQLTDRKGMHLAQVLKMALDENGTGTSTAYPEKKYTATLRPSSKQKTVRMILGLGILSLGIFLWNTFLNDRK